MRTDRVPLKDAEGNVTGIVGFAVDITERKQAEEALQKSMAELERFTRLAVGRELKMIKLKQEVKQLYEHLGEKPPYDLFFVGGKTTNRKLCIINKEQEIRSGGEEKSE